MGADTGTGYRDYVGPDMTQASTAQASTEVPGIAQIVPPNQGTLIKDLSPELKRAAAAAKARQVPTRVAAPYRKKNEGLATALSTSTTVCNYYPNILTGSPAPPVSGSSFAVAKAINGAPLARAGKNPGIFQGGQAMAQQSGTGNTTTSRTSVAEAGVALGVGAGWPAGSSIQFWYNPIFRGRGSTVSGTSPLQSQSTGYVQEKIDSGAGFSTEISYQNLWDLELSNQSGVGQTTPTWVWPGVSNGGFFYRQVPVTAAGTYKFTLRTTTKASATAVYGAGASARMDFGSGILDTPANMSPYNFYIMPNASTATGQPYGHVTIAYVLPSGWGIGC